MIERKLSTRVEVDFGADQVPEIVVELEWNGAHTVNSYIAEIGDTAASRHTPRGTCSIGDYAEDAATLEQFLECVREFEADPFNHPLWTG